MAMFAVKSSAMRGVEHEAAGQSLLVTFPSGDVHRYHGVTKAQFDDMMAAPSLGKHFNARIKPHHYAEKVR